MIIASCSTMIHSSAILFPESIIGLIYVILGLPGVAQDDSNEVIKILGLKFCFITKVCGDSQTLAFQGPSGPSRPCPCGHTLLKGSTYFEQTLQLSLTFIGSERPRLQKHIRPSSFQIRIWGPKRLPAPTKLGCPATFTL